MLKKVALLLAMAAGVNGGGTYSNVDRRRRIDEIHPKRLFSPYMHSKTRAAHKRIMSTWKAPQAYSTFQSPLVVPISYGADPSGNTDSTAAFASAIQAVFAHNASGHKMSEGIIDLGGCVLDLQGGDYLISAPLVIPPGFGNVRIIDGTLRASASFPVDRYIIEIGANTCKNGQGSCNENVGMSGLTLDGSHVAAGCLKVTATMGATLDSSSAIFGFVTSGVELDGGHEFMMSDTWIAAYFWDSPKKEKNTAIGVAIRGNDHYITNTIVFSAQVGILLTGAANILNGVHTWNDATGNGGVGIMNTESQNRFQGCYLDFTDLVLTNAQQVTIAGGFFLGGAQVMLAAQQAKSSVFGLSLVGNEWYDTGSPALAVNETAGTWAEVTDFAVMGTALSQGQPAAPVGRASKLFTPAAGSGTPWSVDFSDVLLFPSVSIASVQVQTILLGPAEGVPPIVSAQASGRAVTIFAPFAGGQAWNGGYSFLITIDQSASTTTF